MWWSAPVGPEHRAALQRVLTDAGRLPKPGGTTAAAAALQGALAKAAKTFGGAGARLLVQV